MYDTAHFYVTFGGTVLTGMEIWQTGIRYSPDQPHTAGELLNGLDQISVADIYNDFAAVIKNQITDVGYPNHTAATFCKVAVINPDGSYAGAPKVHSQTTPGWVNTFIATPPQLSIVATLNTAQVFGKAQKGRMYWPLPGTMATKVDPITGQLPQALVNSLRDLIITAINDANGELSTLSSGATFPAVMSPAGAGTTNPINRLAVGRVVDTQRRRRNNLTETYSWAPVST